MRKLIVIFFFGSLLFYLALNYFIGKGNIHEKFSFLDNDEKQIIKKYIFPYKFISQQQLRISSLEDQIAEFSPVKFEYLYKESLIDISVKKVDDFKLSENKIVKKYKLINGFYTGIHNEFPGSGFIDFDKNNFFILSARGILAYTKKIDDEFLFKQIKNNINDFINLKQFEKDKSFSLKDLLISNNKIFISYTEEVEDDCWNTSVIYGNLDYETINFSKLFSSKDCISSYKNIDKEFNALQSGGRIIQFDDNNILLSVGEYRSRFLTQNLDNINGKIIKINISNLSYEFFSMGHRNIQGLYFDKESNMILATEHGPQGGDEINIIEIDKVNADNPLNYGWPIASYGEHYGGKNAESNKKKYEKYPLYKSHKQFGFIEPLKFFVPSIGISEITKIKKNRYALGSLNERSLYFFDIVNGNIINFEKFELNERIRDLNFKNGKLYMYLEDSGSIGILEINDQ